jgi:RNA polymerase sigma factor (sigma-70 family)
MSIAPTINSFFVGIQSRILAAEAIQPETNDLIKRCIAGESRAEFELYKQYAKAMYNVCLRICNHETEAQDILQEAFITAFKKIASFRQESTFGAWLKKIVVNTAINYVRKRRIDFAQIEQVRGVEDETEKHNNIQEQETYQVEQVKTAIRKLPDGFRVVLSLYLLEGYDHAEIAEVLSISESTSKSQYNRAKAKLREIMATK